MSSVFLKVIDSKTECRSSSPLRPGKRVQEQDTALEAFDSGDHPVLAGPVHGFYFRLAQI